MDVDAARPVRRRLLTWGLPALAVAAVLVAGSAAVRSIDTTGADSFPDVSRSSTIAWADDGRTLWVTSPDDDQVVEIDPDTLDVVRRLAVEGQPRQLTALGDHLVVTADRSTGIGLIDLDPLPHDPVARDGAVVSTVRVPCGGSAAAITIAAAPDGPERDLTVVTCPHDDVLAVVDLERQETVGTITLAGRPTGIVRSRQRITVSTSGDGRLHTFAVDDVVEAVDQLAPDTSRDPAPALQVAPTSAHRAWVDGNRTPSSLTALDTGPRGPLGVYQVVDNQRKLTRAEIEAGSTYGTPTDGRARLEPAIAGACGARFGSLTDEPRRLSGPVALAAAPSDGLVWVVGEFSHSVSVVRCSGEAPSHPSDTVATFAIGEGGRGIVLSDDGTRAYVDVGFDHQVAELRLPAGASEVGGDEPIERLAPEQVGRRSVEHRYLSPLAQQGRRMFNDATNTHLTPFGVVTCGSCHPSAGDDGLSWRIETSDAATKAIERKVRRTPPAWQVNPTVKPLHWNGEFTSSDALALDTVQQLLGGDGLLVDTAALSAYMAEVTAPVGPGWDGAAERAEIERGEAVAAAAGCTACHSGDVGTDGKAHDVLSPSEVADGRLDEVVTPPLRAVRGRAPYGHDGRAPTLEALLGEHGDGTGAPISLTPEELAAVLVYLESF